MARGLVSRLLVACLGAATAAALSRRAPCNCATSLLQRGAAAAARQGDASENAKPRDCTCINGMKTYPTTPRDELKAMGPVALRRKKQKLEAEQKKLEAEKEEQLKSNKKMVDKAKAGLEEDQDAYEDLVKTNRDKRADTKAAHLKARNEATKLTDDLRLAKNEAREKKNQFTKHTSELQGAMLKMATCQCKEATAAALIERRKQAGPDQEAQVQEMVREVEALETKNLDLTDALKKDATQTGRTLSSVDSQKNSIEIREKEAQSLDNKIKKDKMLAAAEAQVEILQGQVDTVKAHTKSVEERCQQLEAKLGELKDELSSCGCA